MVMVEAIVMDSTHLELSRPIFITRGKTVLVTLAEAADHNPERQQWLDGSAGSLQTAYSDSEPEYKPGMVSQPSRCSG